MLACALAPRPEATSADVFKASQAAAKANKTARSLAGAPSRSKMDGAKAKWQEQLALLNSALPALSRHRLQDTTSYGDKLVCLN